MVFQAYALFPNIVLSVTIANGELFRIYPGNEPGTSITVHQNSTPLDLSDESVAAGAITAAQEQTLLTDLTQRVTDFVNNTKGVSPSMTKLQRLFRR